MSVTIGAEPRRFNRAQRYALYELARGNCCACGADLAPGWHGDHVVPYVKGGRTDVLNAQALCAACNLRKGAKMATKPRPWPGGDREWQLEGRRCYRETDQRDFLTVATPGAGKTRFALGLLHELLTDGESVRGVVVVPSGPLKRQWADDAADFGIHLNPDFANRSTNPADFHGVVLTYQQLAALPDFHRGLTNVPTTVIFDEPHHMGDGEAAAWGEAAAQAFEYARRRILITGTAWRTSNDRIPFVRYEHDPQAGPYRSRPDYSYGYSRAVAEGVCRRIYFPSFEGKAHWISRHGEELYADLSEKLGQPEAAERLRTILNPHGDWLPSIIAQADARLSEVRRDGHRDAGGLIIARDQLAAQSMAPLVTRISGERPFVAISDNETDFGAIKAWGKGNGRWIIAVRMVTEGVSIPRLRIGVYATNVLTELFFRQFMGRMIRVVPAIEEQSAYMYIPAVRELVFYASRVMSERDHELADEQPAAAPSCTSLCTDDGVAPAAASAYTALDASVAVPQDVIHDERRYTQDELRRARLVRSAVVAAASINDFLVADMLRAAQDIGPSVAADAGPAEAPRYEEREDLRRKANAKMKQLYERLDRTVEAWAINRYLKHETGAAPEESTLAQLGQRIRIIDRMLKDLDYARRCLAYE